MDDREKDRQVLRALAAHGSDLRKVAHIIHYLYFNSIEDAKSVGKELRRAGYENIDVHRAPTSFWKRLFRPKQFACVAETHAVPSESNVFATTDLMNELAEKYDGEYDGWEASVQ